MNEYFINESDPPADRIPSIKRNRVIEFENKIPLRRLSNMKQFTAKL